jgi:hypothetical protein
VLLAACVWILGLKRNKRVFNSWWHLFLDTPYWFRQLSQALYRLVLQLLIPVKMMIYWIIEEGQFFIGVNLF